MTSFFWVGYCELPITKIESSNFPFNIDLLFDFLRLLADILDDFDILKQTISDLDMQAELSEELISSLIFLTLTPLFFIKF